MSRLVAAHPRAQSLLAVVEVAPSIGLKATPAEVDPSALGELSRPLIVHFDGPDAGGFGVLEEVTPTGFRVWDSANGAHTLDRATFLANWSGIVAMVERVEGATALEMNHRRHRFTERVFGASEPPAVTGGHAAWLLRGALGVLVGALTCIAVASLPAEDRIPASMVALLSIAGLVVTVVTAMSTSAQSNPLSERICARGKLVDCHSVLTSQYSRVLGSSLGDAGVAFFGAILLVLAASAMTGPQAAVWIAVGVAFAATVPLSLVLIGIQVAMGQLCTLCLSVHLVNASATATIWLWLRPSHGSASRVAAALLLLALFFGLVLFVGIPLFRKSQALAIVTEMYSRLSGSPFASLAALLTERPIGVRGEDVGVRVGARSADHELVVFVHPSCNRCNSVLQEVAAFAGSGLVEAYVGLAPKDPEERDRRACAAVVAAGLALGSDRLFKAYASAKKNLGALMTFDPVRVLAESLSVASGGIERALEDARRRVDRSESLVDEHAEGTPAIFFDARIYRGPLAHLAFLLAEHPHLLDTTRIQSEDLGRVSHTSS